MILDCNNADFLYNESVWLCPLFVSAEVFRIAIKQQWKKKKHFRMKNRFG